MQPVPRPGRYGFFRRLLFPYSGEDALTFKQSLRVLAAWMVMLPLVLSLCPLGLTLTFGYSLSRIVMLFLFAFFSGFFIFGALGLLVVIVNNQSARIHKRRRATGASNFSGGRDGS
jgi:hypothetical protein